MSVQLITNFKLVLLGSALVIFSLVPVATAQETNSANLNIEPFTFEANDGQKIAALRGTLMVPENRTKPDSRLIPINFIRFKSTSDNPGSPIFYLAAGPGASGIATAKGRRFELFTALTAVADVIVFDQRGTGEEDMSCPDPITLPIDRVADYPEMLQLIIKQSLPCKKFYQDQGYDLAGYTTAESAHDVNDLRKALGLKKINLLGVSYASHYALAILKLHEEAIDRVVIGGVQGLHQYLKLPSTYDKHFDDINALIQQDPKFSSKIPNLSKMFRTVLKRLEEKPEIVTILDKKSGENIDVHVGKFAIQLQIWSMSGRNSASAAIPAMIYQMYRGDFQAAAKRTLQLRNGLNLSAMTTMMNSASGGSKARINRINGEAPGSLFGHMVHLLFPEIGAAWNAPDLGNEYRSPVRSDVPVLLISGTMDARTPVENAVEVAKYLPNSQHMIVTNTGHPPSFVMLKDQVRAFFTGERLETLCIEGPKVVFDPLD